MPDSPRILVVDDDPDLTFLVAELLNRDGYLVETATEGQAAIAAANSFRPQVVLLDLVMSGMNGYEVARRLRQDSNLDGLVIIAMSGNAIVGDEVVTKGTDINQYLLKPFRMADFKQAVEIAGIGSDASAGRPS